MSINVVAHNLMAMNANRQLNIVTGGKAKITEKLSSGYRVNRAADDAAGLAISEKMRRQIHGLTQASRNAQDGISMMQIADGAMSEINDMLHRGTILSIQASNDTLSSDDRKYIQMEIDQIKNEINDIRERATFNEIPVLKGSGNKNVVIDGNVAYEGGLPPWVKSAALDAGYPSGNYKDSAGSSLHAGYVDFSSLNAGNVSELVGTGFSFTCATCSNHYSISFSDKGATGSVETSGSHKIYNVNVSGIKDGKTLVNEMLKLTGGSEKELASHYNRFAVDPSNPAALVVYDERSYITPTNSVFKKGVAKEVGDVDVPEIDHDIYLQVGAEYGQRLGITLPDVSCSSLKISGVDVTTTEGAQAAISSFKGANAYLSQERAMVGAYQNRLEHTIKNLDNIVENTTAAESKIRDTDMSTAMVEFTNDNVLSQVGSSMLAQANTSNQTILSLLNA